MLASPVPLNGAIRFLAFVNMMYPKAQHYVPQFYLRNFAIIYCFDKVTRKIFRPNVKNVANQTGFYNFTAINGDEKSIENLFNDVEAKTKIAIQTIIEKPTISTLLENRIALSYFFALQESRTLVFRDIYDDMIRGANLRLQKDGFNFQIPTENDTKEFQARFLIDTSTSIANVLLELKWILVSNITNKPFWTSDNPIIRYNPHKSELVGNLGLKSSGIQLHIPISPWFAILICDPFEYAHVDPETTAEPPNIDFINSGQVLISRQYVFSVDDDFYLAQEMLNKNPDISNPNRPRIIVN